MKKIILCLLFLCLISCIERKEVKCIVINHNVTTDRYGNAHYNTLCKDINGNIQEFNGYYFYNEKIGDTITAEFRYMK